MSFRLRRLGRLFLFWALFGLPAPGLLAGSLSYTQLGLLLSKPLSFGPVALVTRDLSQHPQDSRFNLTQAHLDWSGQKVELDGAYVLHSDQKIRLIVPRAFTVGRPKGLKARNLELSFGPDDLSGRGVERFDFKVDQFTLGNLKAQNASGSSLARRGPARAALRLERLVWLKDLGLSVPVQFEWKDVVFDLQPEGDHSQGTLDFTLTITSPELELKGFTSKNRIQVDQKAFFSWLDEKDPKKKERALHRLMDRLATSWNSQNRLSSLRYVEPRSGEEVLVESAELDLKQGKRGGFFSAEKFGMDFRFKLDHFVASLLGRRWELGSLVAQGKNRYSPSAFADYHDLLPDQRDLGALVRLLEGAEFEWTLELEHLSAQGGKEPLELDQLKLTGQGEAQNGELGFNAQWKAQGERPKRSGVLGRMDHQGSLRLKKLDLEGLEEVLGQRLSDTAQGYALLWYLSGPQRLELDSHSRFDQGAEVTLKLARTAGRSAVLELGYLDFLARTDPSHSGLYFLNQWLSWGRLMGSLSAQQWDPLLSAWGGEQAEELIDELRRAEGDWLALHGPRLSSDWSFDQGRMTLLGEYRRDLSQDPLYLKSREEVLLRPLYARYLEEGAQAAFWIGRLVAEGRQLPPNDQRALTWFEEAHQAKDENATAYLGGMMVTGRGRPQDLKQGFALLRPLVEKGNPYALHFAGRAAEEGFGQVADPALAGKLYLKAAQAGLDLAQYALGRLLIEHRQTEEDFETGLAWLEQAAATQPQAAFLAYRIYAKGDPKKAQAYLEQAARLGHAQAAAQLSSP